jgi:hypothetical protein
MSGDAFVKLPGLGLNSQSLMLPQLRQPSRSGGCDPGPLAACAVPDDDDGAHDGREAAHS